ncbi:Beta-glucosidase 17 [Dionaea muscipula]
MANQRCPLSMICGLFLLATASSSSAASSLNRQSFPDGFMFGASSSAYQYEGAASEDGKGPNIWDVFTHEYPDKISDHSNGDVADDMYHRFKDDIRIIKKIGLDMFRFSISWSRILPKGKLSLGVNQLGIQYYNDLINELIANGIKPFVTLFHWDPPQALEDEYGGFLSSNIVNDYSDYVDLCFKEFGDRVKYWVTLNEPNHYSVLGYADGTCAPGRCSKYINNCTAGNSATEPYQVAHNLLLSHASAVRLYKQRYQASQKGLIGMITSSNWYIPLNNTTADCEAAARAYDFMAGWFLEPITYGHYPKTMRSIVGSRLPNFTEEQSQILKHSYDYFGLNYYTTSYAANDTSSTSTTELSYTTDSHVTLTHEKDGVPIGEPTAVDWLYIFPKGIRYMTKYVKEKYGNAPIIITENGVGDANNYTLPISKAVQDYQRIRYHRLHLASLLKAIKDGVDVQGYQIWSLFDDFEWNYGYTYRFGLNYIDYKHGLTRYPKYSALWLKKFLQKQSSSNRGYSPM